MLSRTQPSFADFSSTAGLITNGFGGAADTRGTAFEILNDQSNQARSVWWNQTVPVGSFVSHFQFNSNAANPHEGSGQGFVFTIQNNDTTQVGGTGGALGYQGIGNSVGVIFDLYTGGGFGSNVGFVSDGNGPNATTDASPLDFHSGDTFNTTISYDGTTLTLTVTDASDSSKTITTSENVDIPGTVGGSNAYIGFTTGSGTTTSFLDLPKWDYVSSTPVTIATPAAASPTSITGNSTQLSVLGASQNGENTLKYLWTTVAKPGGAANPTFSANGTNAAKATSATFSKDGGYHLRCTITDANGLLTTSDVSVRVEQTATSIRMTPHGARVHRGKHLQIAATVLDQFGHALRTQPRVVYSVLSGSGRIRSTTGLFTAGTSTGPATIQADDSGLTATLRLIVA